MESKNHAKEGINREDGCKGRREGSANAELQDGIVRCHAFSHDFPQSYSYTPILPVPYTRFLSWHGVWIQPNQ